MSDITEPVGNDELRIRVEMGDGYQASPRLAEALNGLAAALQAEGDEDVTGHAYEKGQEVKVDHRAYSFVDNPMAGKTSLKWCMKGFNDCKITTWP